MFSFKDLAKSPWPLPWSLPRAVDLPVVRWDHRWFEEGPQRRHATCAVSRPTPTTHPHPSPKGPELRETPGQRHPGTTVPDPSRTRLYGATGPGDTREWVLPLCGLGLYGSPVVLNPRPHPQDRRPSTPTDVDTGLVGPLWLSSTSRSSTSRSYSRPPPRGTYIRTLKKETRNSRNRNHLCGSPGRGVPRRRCAQDRVRRGGRSGVRVGVGADHCRPLSSTPGPLPLCRHRRRRKGCGPTHGAVLTAGPPIPTQTPRSAAQDCRPGREPSRGICPRLPSVLVIAPRA